jgi:hypothetical protein
MQRIGRLKDNRKVKSVENSRENFTFRYLLKWYMEFHITRTAVEPPTQRFLRVNSVIRETGQVESKDKKVRKSRSTCALSVLFLPRLTPSSFDGSFLSKPVYPGGRASSAGSANGTAQCSTRAVWPLHNFVQLPVRRGMAPRVLSRLVLFLPPWLL